MTIIGVLAFLYQDKCRGESEDLDGVEDVEEILHLREREYALQ
jgi:hypothetical protein